MKITKKKELGWREIKDELLKKDIIFLCMNCLKEMDFIIFDTTKNKEYYHCTKCNARVRVVLE